MTEKNKNTVMAEALSAAIVDGAKNDDKTASTSIGAPVATIDTEDRKDVLPVGSGDMDTLFTSVRLTLVSGDVYARERERRGKTSLTVGYSRKVADAQIELAGTGIYTPGTISIVQGINEKHAHLEMSIGVFNPETRKSSFTAADAATKDRLQQWKDRTCARFLADCQNNNIDLNAPVAPKDHVNAVSVNLLPNAPVQQ